MKSRNSVKSVLLFIQRYTVFFFSVALTVTCTVSLFVGILSENSVVVLTAENLGLAAKATLACVLLLSLIFTFIDILRRKFTTEKITKHITDTAKEIVNGNFSARISPVPPTVIDGNYNEIILCFNKMAEELGSLETLRTDFTANVSHEMKTPLSIMQNYASLLKNGDLPEEKQIEYAKCIYDGAHQLSDMITNILKLNRLDNQQIYQNRENFNLGEQICECLLQYESIWEKKNIELTAQIDENITVNGDRELLALVWNNLFSNAFKFTPDNGSVSVSLTCDGDFAKISVSDTGCGISSEDGARIFEKFYQCDTSHSAQGNGLGLALVKRVTDILKGEISVESTLGVGTVFTVKIRKN